MARVSVHIVNRNGAEVLGDTLDSLRAQTFTDFTVTVVDDASTDGSVDVVRERFPEATVLRNFKDLGAARAANQAFTLARQRWMQDDKAGRSSVDRYVLAMAPDVVLPAGWLSAMLERVDRRQEIGAACGKLLRALPRVEESADLRFTGHIESAGLILRKDRRALDRGAGETDAGRRVGREEVFGAPGALALYRAEALAEAAEAMGGELYDEDLGSYEEDIDLAWRLRLLGWKAAYVPDAVAYRRRGGPEGGGLVARWRRSALAERLKLRNRMLRAFKLDDVANALLHLPFIVASAVASLLGTLVFSPAALSAYPQALAKLPRMWRKRRAIMKRRRIAPRDIRRWME